MANDKDVILPQLKHKKRAAKGSKSTSKMTPKEGSRLASEIFDKLQKNKQLVTKGEKFLDDLWKQYLDTIAEQVLGEDASPEARKEFIKKGKGGWGNKGRELEFKLFFISGNISELDITDNFPAWAAGDLIQEIQLEVDGKLINKVIDAQIKGPRASIQLPLHKIDEEADQRIEELQKLLNRMGQKYLNNSSAKAEFKKQAVDRVNEAIETRVRIMDDGKDVIQRDRRENIIKFFTAYQKYSPSDYLLLGLGDGDNLSDFVVSVPHEKLVAFAESYWKNFTLKFDTENSKDRFLGVRWEPTRETKEPFMLFLLGSQEEQFHIHSLYGQAHFSKYRNEEFKHDKNRIEKHRDFLKSNPRIFEEPHLAFFGRDYKPIS